MAMGIAPIKVLHLCGILEGEVGGGGGGGGGGVRLKFTPPPQVKAYIY